MKKVSLALAVEGDPAVEIFANFTEKQSRLALWALFGDWDGEFRLAAAAYASKRRLDPPEGRPEEVVAVYGNDFAAWAYENVANFLSWLDGFMLAGSSVREFLDNIEGFMESTWRHEEYRGAPSWNVKMTRIALDAANPESVSPKNPDFADRWKSLAADVFVMVVEESWSRFIRSCGNALVSFEPEGRNGGHAVPYLKGERMRLPLAGACRAARAAAFLLEYRDDARKIAEAFEKLDRSLQTTPQAKAVTEMLERLVIEAEAAWSEGLEWPVKENGDA